MSYPDDDEYAPITKEYLCNSIITSYPPATLELFKDRMPDMWAEIVSTIKPKLRIV